LLLPRDTEAAAKGEQEIAREWDSGLLEHEKFRTRRSVMQSSD